MARRDVREETAGSCATPTCGPECLAGDAAFRVAQ